MCLVKLIVNIQRYLFIICEYKHLTLFVLLLFFYCYCFNICPSHSSLSIVCNAIRLSCIFTTCLTIASFLITCLNSVSVSTAYSTCLSVGCAYTTRLIARLSITRLYYSSDCYHERIVDV